ncbi:polysaccharide pyruvyl transferase CsaB [Vulcanibacillus modesticaldus]|uniref:polysaccharide pyruvyl transferase CsaB n=1 Tax=Vulcanibacillus modesticaldus TaxID=337097 RepID=UPI000A721995|nr:polysaccharide pyruvyl transferase CsaB [Vulcanibacillus modesticaldus]
MKRVLISGYYGFDNAGDEAVLQSIIEALKKEAPFIKPVVLSANPEKTAKLYKVEAVHRFRLIDIWKSMRQADGLISGGGSLLQDATGKLTIPYYMGIIQLAQLLGKPTFIYAQGIGPVHRKGFYPVIRSGFNKAKYISTRDRESAKLLQEMKISADKIDVVVDPVLNLSPITKQKVQKILQKEKIAASPVLISVRFWKNNTKYLDIIAQVADELVKAGEQVVFVPMHEPVDREASQYVLSKMAQEAQILNEYDVRTLMGIIGESKLMIGMRLHALIIATAMGIPSIGISYDPKIDQFLAQLNQTPVGTTDDLDFKTLLDQVKYVLAHIEDNRQEVEKRLPALKELAWRPAKMIAQFYTKNN